MMRVMEDRVPNEVLDLFAARGHETYSERVTMAEHACQAAALAHADGADDALVLAALLHDMGHFLSDPDSAFGVTDHGTTGGAWVAERFVDGVSEPVRLHVAAKRYRCFVDPGYEAQLSPASIGTLKLQGGPMSDDEAAAFEAEPFAVAALAVRAWDDGGKVDGLDIPAVDHWRPLLDDPEFRR
jgi:gamma-butyrobetaine dioxygenase